nr:eukaryotic translation initiation factor 5B-like [Aegilops tauschii subsp. strangulata]
MAQSSKEQSGSEGELPQLPPMSERMRLTSGGKSSKPPKTQKKKSESESEEQDDDIPSAHSQPEDELVTDAVTLFFDGNPKKGGRGREKNTTAEMSDPESYKTPPGVETTTERNNRLQRIQHHWAKKWFNYENVQRKYQIMFAFTPPWNDFIAENCIGPDDEKVRPPPPSNAHADSLKTIANFPEEVEKRDKAKAKCESKVVKKNQVEERNVALTQQDIQKKKYRASKGSKSGKSVSPRAPRKKCVTTKSKKAASDSFDESSEENAPDEIPMYDQRALLNKPYKTPSPVKLSPPLRIKEEERQKAKARASKPKGIKDHRIQNVATDAPIDSSTPLQQIPPSPPHEDEPMQQVEPVVVVIPTPAAQEPDVVDIFLNKSDEENALPKQQVMDDKTDEEIEVEKAVPSPPKEMQAEPSRSNKKENDKVDGELNASRHKITPVTSSGAPTQMDVDLAPASTAP